MIADKLKSIDQELTIGLLSPLAKKRLNRLIISLGVLLSVLFISIAVLFYRGVGIWGINQPVAWGFAIINLVWWIGIGHAGTFISAVLLLTKQTWRNSINRIAEAMTIVALLCAGLFPLLHLGRPWYFYWLFPYPDTMNLYPQFRSPLAWDVFAVLIYTMISLIFLYLGMVPDWAVYRSRTKSAWLKKIIKVMTFGWSFKLGQWLIFERTMFFLAGFATVLVISVHSIISFDFSVGNVSGWHSTIFPPYFVVGAVFSGFAMIICLLVPLRKYLHLESFITEEHLDKSAKMMLYSGMLMIYFYILEFFMMSIAHHEHEQYLLGQRAFGAHGVAFWSMILFNCLLPLTLLKQRWRSSHPWLVLVSLGVLVGMWLERYIIIVTSLENDRLPSVRQVFVPTAWDWSLFAGTIILFIFLFLVFIRFFPFLPIAEIKTWLEEKEVEDE